MSRAIRPLSVGIVCYPSLGGSGVIATALAFGLAQRGHRVHVIASAPPSRPLPAHENLQFHPVAVSDYPLFDYPQYALSVAAAIVRVSQEQHLDVVHAHYAIPHAASAYLARQVLGDAAPCFVTTLHGTDVTGTGSDASYQAITRFTVAASDAITVPSAFLRHAAYQELSLPSTSPVDVIPNFVDTDHFIPAQARDRGHLQALFAQPAGESDAVILFHVSNLRAVKRPADLMEVLARVRRRQPARLLVVGDGPLRQQAEQRAHELGIAEHVGFLGKRADFAGDLKHADAFLLPSASESFGVAALEALSAGVPVCAYNVGGLAEVVSEDAGRLVQPFDVDALAHAVIDVVSVPARRDELGRAARRRALAHFQREPALQLYEASYRRVLERRRRDGKG